MPVLNEVLLDERLAQLERAYNWSPRLISKLEAFIRTADDYALFRVDPLQYAAEKGVAENEAIDLFLHASKLGLFDLEWNLICGCCGQVFSSLRSLSKLHTRFVCNVCRMENDLQLDERIQVSFTVAPAIRDNIFHSPAKLPADDYIYRYCLAKGITREPGLGPNAAFIKKYTPVLSYLEAGQTLTVDTDLTPGLVYAGDVFSGNLATFEADPAVSAEGKKPVHITFGLPDMQVAEPPTAPQQLLLATAHGDETYNFTHFAQIPTGRTQFVFENRLSERICINVFDAPADIASSYMQLPPYLSGKRLLTSQTFRNLYRSEVIDANEGISIRDITFLFTDLKGSTALYDQLGDLKAYHLVRQHFEALNSVIVKNSGAIVKTIGDAVMASFCTPLEGLQAALEIFQAIDEFNSGRTEKLILKIGLHTGHSIAVTLNDRLDYFGQTVNIAARVQGLAEANEIYISQDVYAYAGVSGILNSYNVTPAQVSVKGVSGMLQIYKITSKVGPGEQVASQN